MIEEILSDMRAFFTIVGYTLGTVGFALLLLKYGDDGFESAPAAGLTTYSMALLGDFNIDLFRSFGAFSSCLALRFQKNAPSTPLPHKNAPSTPPLFAGAALLFIVITIFANLVCKAACMHLPTTLGS